ncbi:MAG: hypothetical protein ACOZNI_24485 [Myxococcota bacterium]
MLLASLALAQDASTPPAWEDRYDNGMGLAKAGVITGAVGAGAATTGLVLAVGGAVSALNGSGSDGTALLFGGVMMAVGGTIAMQVGAPLMAAGSLKSRNALRDGGVDVTATPGWLAWGLWGGNLGFLALSLATDDVTGDIDPLSLAASACLAGSYVSGGIQMGKDTGAFRGRRVSLMVAPMAVREGAGAGVAFAF